ncbi:MAG: 3-deoxy-7-phosphoheptulonate synthase [Candidatus Eremiobacterota bacterium]
MIIVLRPDASEQQIRWIEEKLQSRGLVTRTVDGAERSVVAVIGIDLPDSREVGLFPGVLEVIRVSRPYKLAAREAVAGTSTVQIGNVTVGGTQVAVIAGPCSVESREGLLEAARHVWESGASMLRGGAFKPRTSPYAFQGMGEQGLKILAEARERYDLPIVTEVMSVTQVELVARYADVLQIGARNMQNFDLLKAVAQAGKPVLLKRGLAATIEELLMAAEYVLAGDRAAKVLLCERGIRTFESSTRNTLDLSAIPVLRSLSHLPIVVDPSHGTGNRNYVAAMALAAVAAGADALMVEMHPNPPEAISDGAQSLYPAQLQRLMRDLEVIAPVVGRQVEGRYRRYVASVDRPVEVRGSEQALRVALQGEGGSFSEKAAHQFFGPDIQAVSYASFQEVFQSVASGDSHYAVIPVENSLTGSIHRNYDLFLEHPELIIVGEIKVRVVHNLLANPGVEIGDVKTVYAHPQAAAQCDQFLRQHPEWTVVSTHDTAGSARHVKEHQLVDAAGIASAEAARKLGMVILAASIETHAQNFTRFLVVTARPTRPEAPDKVSLVFETEHTPGALYRALSCFAESGLNLIKLESRPIPGKPWVYMFYLDVRIPDPPQALDRALGDLAERVPFLRVLGRYRAAD